MSVPFRKFLTTSRPTTNDLAVAHYVGNFASPSFSNIFFTSLLGE